jgi:4-amino-4-deoxy-L-arabinose transferase-like glycosyltransferase
MALRKPHLILLAALLIYFLYFFHLTATGMLGPDEPRYAAIGREMARSEDWITPRLWGEPWFEKPSLLYWMTAAAFRFGLSDDAAPRVPVALVSVAFLAAFFYLLRRQFGNRPALFATVILGTSAGWIGLSQAGVVDIPLAASFTLAVLLARPWSHTGDRRLLPFAAACLGIAVLAKGGVALVLILPVLWVGRHYWRDLFRPSVWGSFLALAAPWYLLCYLKNGNAFLNSFFWRHQVERLVSNSLQHVQPVWFYLPVLLAGIFPWTPLMALVLRGGPGQSTRRIRTLKESGDLLLIVAFGLIFFSISLNKLPEYLLPLLPSLAVILGVALADLPEAGARRILVLCAALACLSPIFGGLLPDALSGGITRSHLSSLAWLWILPVALGPLLLRRVPAVIAIAVGVTAAVAFLKISSLPAIDERVSARPVWRRIARRRDDVCVDSIHRRYRYGLNYYSVIPLPDCSAIDKPLHLVQRGSDPPAFN